MTRFVVDAFKPTARFDMGGFKHLVRISTRMLDNVLDTTFWPLEAQRDEAMAKRRIGLGFLGLGSALAMLGIRYNTVDGRAFAAEVSEVMRDEAYMASVELAEEKGSFPFLDIDKYFSGASFATRLPDEIKEAIRSKGIRNSHLLSIAPTGTISLAFADNASNGIEPPFALTYKRKKRMAAGDHRLYDVEDSAYRLFRHLYGPEKELPESFVTALNISAQDHLKMVAAVAPYIDTSISKTVNIPEDYPFEQFADLYFDAWKSGLKGLATYRPNSVLGSVLSVASEEKPKVVEAVLPDCDPLRKPIDRRVIGDLAATNSKFEYSTFEGKKSIFISITYQMVPGVIDGKPVEIERPIEFFIPASQQSEGQQWVTSTMRQLSLLARSGGPVAKAIADMRKVIWDKGLVTCGAIEKIDGTKVPLRHGSEVAAIGYLLQQILQRRGFLDADGNQVPVKVLARSSQLPDESVESDTVGTVEEAANPATQANVPQTGKKCPACGNYTYAKRDGCDVCMDPQCGHTGSCG